MIKDAHNALLDIQSSGRAKELLGQGLLLRSLQERNAEQEKVGGSGGGWGAVGGIGVIGGIGVMGSIGGYWWYRG